jgi:hypothetical protein
MNCVASAKDIVHATKTIPSSTTPQMMKQYDEFAKARFR